MCPLVTECHQILVSQRGTRAGHTTHRSPFIRYKAEEGRRQFDSLQMNNTRARLCNEASHSLAHTALGGKQISARHQHLKGHAAEPNTVLFGAVLIFKSITKFCLGALSKVHLE